MERCWPHSNRSISLKQYKGKPFEDNHYKTLRNASPVARIVGYMTSGAKGLHIHDSGAENHGSGGLNPADGTYLNEFRMHEGFVSVTCY